MESFYLIKTSKTFQETQYLPLPCCHSFRLTLLSNYLLADAGWHCSFCFRYILYLVFEMQACSHVDRNRHASFLNPKRIQDITCKGTDIFDILPEELSFKGLNGKLGALARSFSGVHLLKSLLQHSTSHKFLLPGNCNREKDPATGPSIQMDSNTRIQRCSIDCFLLNTKPQDKVAPKEQMPVLVPAYAWRACESRLKPQRKNERSHRQFHEDTVLMYSMSGESGYRSITGISARTKSSLSRCWSR